MRGVRLRRRLTEPSLRVVRIDAPLAWARRHEDVVVAFEKLSRGKWSAYLVGDDGAVLLSFDWLAADGLLAGEEWEEFPIKARDETWLEFEQGWFGWVKSDGEDVYVAEGPSEDMVRLRKGRKPT
jgi:hypothetical protein